MLALALSLIICGASPPAAEPVAAFRALRLEHPALFVAPDLPEPDWQSLPGEPLDVPEDGRCYDKGGAELPAGAYLPRGWADALRLQLQRGEVYPARAQKRLDELGDLALIALDAQGQAVRADTAVEVARARMSGGPSIWDYLPPVAIALAIGLGAGIATGAALAR